MLKNKTEQNMNDEKYSQTGITVIIHANHDSLRATTIMLWSVTSSSLRWSTVITVRQALTSLGHRLSEQQRALSDILSNVLSGQPHQSQQPSFMVLSSQASFIFLWIQLSFIHKTWALGNLLSNCHVKKLLRFISHNLARFCRTFHFQNPCWD